MTADVETFEDHILRVVDRFLQTVVVIDDRAFTNTITSRSQFKDEASEAPGGRAVQGDLKIPELDNDIREYDDEHDLDAKKVTDAFTRSGLICGLLEPPESAELDEELLQGIRRADLIVLDWVLHKDEGRKAVKIVRRILGDEAGSAEKQRLRTIAIYTGQPNLPDIAKQMKGIIEQVYPGEVLKEYDNGLTLMKGPVRIAVFAKENASILADNLADRRVPFDGLPGRMRKEFAALTKGLVTAVALAALAALRDDTHRILKVLNPGLDAAYVGNRSILRTPSDAQGLAVRLVSAEIASVIEDHDIGEQVNDQILSLWLDQPRDAEHRFGRLVEPEGRRISMEQIQEMVCRGLGSDDSLNLVLELGEATTKLNKKQWGKIAKQPSYVFASTADEAAGSAAELIQLLTLKTTYTLPERILQLGTIVRAPRGEYLVCVQPLCDSVRLGSQVRPFPFLRLENSNPGSRSHFVLPVKTNKEPQYVLLKTNPRDIVMKRFKPRDGHDVIQAVSDSRGYVFQDTSGSRFRWICQLKTEFAQKVAVDLGHEFAQVAVDEAEALRLSRR